MSVGDIELALGTVQFGLAYGVSGQGAPTSASMTRTILEHASDAGILRLDTAPAYGDIEERLAGLIGDLHFEVVSKFPTLPVFADEHSATEFIVKSFHRSHARLGALLRGMLFHRCEDVLGPYGPAIWDAALSVTGQVDVSIGVSCYDPALAADLKRDHAIKMVQMPGNALDQRSTESASQLDGVEVSFRSLFLQGLLLLPEADAIKRVPAAAAALKSWHIWCCEHQLAPLHAAIGITKGLPNGRYCLVGVDNPAQLDEITAAWAQSNPLAATSIASADPDVIDPRLWKVAA